MRRDGSYPLVAVAMARSAGRPEVKAMAPDVVIGRTRPAMPARRISEPVRLIRDEKRSRCRATAA
jgi:hypothetical protein